MALLLGLCVLLLAGTCSAEGGEGPALVEEFTERRDFRGFVRRDMAERAAQLAAELAAYEHASRQLAKEPDLHFANAGAGLLFNGESTVSGLARMLFSTLPAGRGGVEGFPPNMRAVARVRLAAPEQTRAALLQALQRQDVLDIYAHLLEAERALLKQYDAVAEGLLPLRPAPEGGKEKVHLLQSILNEMRALELFTSLLPLYDQHWSLPGKTREELARAERLAPDNPLILTALAEVLLQLDRPVQAFDAVSRALAREPGYARAHDVKGAVLLRQRLPSLAAEAFGQAISLSPNTVSYYTHRASAYLVLEEEDAMCADFQKVCSLGNCEGLQWAREHERCREVAQ